MVQEGNVTLDLPTLSEPTKPQNDPKPPKVPKEKPQISETQCYVCGELFSDKTKLIEHIKSKHFSVVKSSMYGPPRSHQCPQCKIVFSSHGALGLHICGELPPRWRESTLGSKTCTECGQKFNKRFDLLCHITKKHTKTKNFACEHCDYKASVPFLLTKHMRRKHSEHREKSHLCQDCGAMFTERTFLNAHINNVHKTSKENSFCVYCGLTVRSQSGLMKHLKEVHNKDSDQLLKVENKYKCGSCDVTEETVEALHSHLKACHKDLREMKDKAKYRYKFACEHCNKVVSNRYTLEYHINKYHEMIKRYPCSQCPEAFYDSLSLKKHEDKHNGINQFECSHCHKVFASKALCTRHVKTIHEKNEVYKCDLCGFKTFHPTSMTVHRQQVHEKLRPNQCEYCEEAFYYKRDLEKHVTKIHDKHTVTYVIDGTTVTVETQ